MICLTYFTLQSKSNAHKVFYIEGEFFAPILAVQIREEISNSPIPATAHSRIISAFVIITCLCEAQIDYSFVVNNLFV